MLIFTYASADLSEQQLVLIRKKLEKETGQSCLVVQGCTGIYEVASEKERLDEGGK